MAALASAPAGFDVLIEASPSGDAAALFRLRGREYRVVPGGCSTWHADDNGVEAWTLRVWTKTGRMTDVTVKATDRVVVLSYARVWDRGIEITPSEAGVVEEEAA